MFPSLGQEHAGLRKGGLTPWGARLNQLSHTVSLAWAPGPVRKSLAHEVGALQTGGLLQAQFLCHQCLVWGGGQAWPSFARLGSVQHLVQLVLLTEAAGEGEAVEVFDPGPVDGVNVQPEDQGGEEAGKDQQ